MVYMLKSPADPQMRRRGARWEASSPTRRPLAGVIAFGSPDQKLKFGWHEEEVDRGNRVVIDTHAIWGFIKTTFNGNDFGVIAIDTASKKP